MQLSKNAAPLKVAILVANGFEQSEMEEPLHALERAGADVFIVSPEKNLVQGWHHMDKGDSFTVDIHLDKAKAEDFDALLLPGGLYNPDHLRSLPEAIDFVKAMHAQKKPIAAICHGPWLLINAGLVRGKKITSWSSIKEDLINAGGEWVDEATVCDGQLLTSRKPADLPAFNKALLALFQQASSG